VSNRPALCLNLIVKNEAGIVETSFRTRRINKAIRLSVDVELEPGRIGPQPNDMHLLSADAVPSHHGFNLGLSLANDAVDSPV